MTIKARLVRLKGVFYDKVKWSSSFYILSLLFGAFINACQSRMVLKLAQQGLKKSLKSFKFDDPELVEILLKYAFLWRNVHGILVKKIKDKQKFSSTEQFVASLMVIL